MAASPIASLAWLAGRRFQSFSEAAGVVVDHLVPHFPDSTILIGQLDDDECAYRIVEVGGEPIPTLVAGSTLPAERVAAIRDTELQAAPEERWSPRLDTDDSVLCAALEMSDGRQVGTLCVISASTEHGASDEGILTVTARLLAHEWERVMWAVDMRRLSDQLRDPMRSDSVTGLLNRDSLKEAVEHERRLSREGAVESYLVVVSITGLHAIRSRYGEPMADLLLRKAAETVTTAIRGGDHAGRLTGDALAAILVDCRDADGASAFCDRLAGTLAHVMGDRSAAVVGTSLVPLRLGDYESADDVLLAATPSARAEAAVRWRGSAA